ncbi:hypothetical protein [Actinoplanes aureus]|uniref:Uncharacterized protein n=1 Tax=Actinoplanes aureus TaxID=2792083 RepID=A0A931CHZ2_9ACTN|nr:hypothetical protein [Actinoplanes aureus]MBG0568352.1 hypothetical protein [Actinoplanes aureus]
MTAAPDEAAAPQRTLGARLAEIANFLAPTTVITALLIYFGAVYTDGRLAYYGIQLGLADLSTQDLVIYGTEAIFGPLALLLIAVVLALAGHAVVTWVLSDESRTTAGLLTAAGVALIGLLLTARAVLGLLVPAVYRNESTALTPLTLSVGPAMLAYAGWIAGQILTRDPHGRMHRWYMADQAGRVRRAAVVSIVVLALAGLFWATNRVAFTLGLNRSYDEAVDPRRAYQVVLDTREPLPALPEGVVEQRLTGAGEDGFGYRYRGFRLILESGGRLFLAPVTWTRDSRTWVIGYDNSVRLQVIPPPANLVPG